MRDYAYDANSNRCAKATSCDGSYLYDNADRLTASPVASSYRYDGHGNMYSATLRTASKQLSESFSDTVSAGGTKTHSVTPTSGGTLSASIDWQSATSSPLYSGLVGPVSQSDHPITVSANGTISATLSWPAQTVNPNLDLALLDSSGNEVASSTALSGNSESVSYAVSGLGAYPASGNYTLRVKSVLLGSDYTLQASFPVTANLNLELYDPSGTKVAQSTSSSAKPETLTFTLPAGTNGTYQVKAVSADHLAPYGLTVEFPRALKQEVRYDANDHAIETDDGFTKVTETLDPQGRVIRRAVSDSVAGTVLEDTIFGYEDGSDSPAYTKPTAGGALTTYLNGPGGLLLIDTSGVPTYPLANGHGDIVGTTDAAGVLTPSTGTDEFGVGEPPPSRLGWLGSHLRFSTGGGLKFIRMGVRFYDPALGRFLSVDPVEGGSANDYDYANQDCVNQYDLDGKRATWKGAVENWRVGQGIMCGNKVARNAGDLLGFWGKGDYSFITNLMAKGVFKYGPQAGIRYMAAFKGGGGFFKPGVKAASAWGRAFAWPTMAVATAYNLGCRAAGY